MKRALSTLTAALFAGAIALPAFAAPTSAPMQLAQDSSGSSMAAPSTKPAKKHHHHSTHSTKSKKKKSTEPSPS